MNTTIQASFSHFDTPHVDMNLKNCRDDSEEQRVYILRHKDSTLVGIPDISNKRLTYHQRVDPDPSKEECGVDVGPS